MSLSKKISLFLSIIIGSLLFFSSCTQEIVFRNPALQAVKDSSGLWLSFDVKCYSLKDGIYPYYLIEAYNGVDNINLRVTSLVKQTYGLGIVTSKSASYTSGTETFKTGINLGSGFVKITDHDTINNTISGVFEFEAMNTNTDTIFKQKTKFTKGVFHKVPIL